MRASLSRQNTRSEKILKKMQFTDEFDVFNGTFNVCSAFHDLNENFNEAVEDSPRFAFPSMKLENLVKEIFAHFGLDKLFTKPPPQLLGFVMQVRRRVHRARACGLRPVRLVAAATCNNSAPRTSRAAAAAPRRAARHPPAPRRAAPRSLAADGEELPPLEQRRRAQRRPAEDPLSRAPPVEMARLHGSPLATAASRTLALASGCSAPCGRTAEPPPSLLRRPHESGSQGAHSPRFTFRFGTGGPRSSSTA